MRSLDYFSQISLLVEMNSFYGTEFHDIRGKTEFQKMPDFSVKKTRR